MLGYRVEEYFPGGYLEVNSENDLLHIVEKPTPGEEPGNLVNILVHLHRDPDALLRQIEAVQTTRDDVYECALDRMLKAGNRIRVIPYDGFWAPIKYPWHILNVMEHFLDGSDACIAPSARISERACIEGKVILGDNVRVLENAVIRGPTYVGPNSIVGNNALVRDYSHIGSNSVIGYCTEVKHSYIGDNCWFHSNYVGDSIIDDDCSLGAGTVLANFRLDEGNIKVKVGEAAVDTGYDKLGAMMGRGCRVGINASIMPGVRVGSHSFVGPHVCLREDLQANKTALADPGYLVGDNDTSLDADKRRELLDRLK
jgi:UDP-N-acetylglucosamine diphosphorylase / glucose-1-phosphate thymidylyltransferase / UDP-N-acetylgalactosamine diphosphorylase / glucosamine-1-phosphate N-acetyltransferase / galactosamine-1-phosphate N-acetyltransferase